MKTAGWYAEWLRLDPYLSGYLRANFIALTTCTTGVAIALSLGYHQDQLSADLIILLATMLLQVVLGYLLIRRYGASGAVSSLFLSSLVSIVGLTWVTPFLAPVTVLVLLVPLMVAHPYLGRIARRLATGAVVVLMTVVATMAEWRRLIVDPPEFPTVAISLGLAVPLVAIVIAQAVRQNYRVLAQQAEDLRQSRRDVVAVADAARRSLERDLHDGAQQRLIGISVRLARLQGLLDAGRLEEARAEVSGLREENLEAVGELRELARGLHPTLLRDRGLVAALNAVALRSPLPCRVRAPGLPRYDDATEAAVYFCIVESLQNAAKHSGAPGVQVTVSADPVLAFEVADDGCGFDTQQVDDRGGLLGMSARVAAAGGRLKIDSARGQGTRITGTFPLAKPLT